jgi:hypothetical protein
MGFFSDDVVAAAAMIDRLVPHADVLTLTGDSYRTRQRASSWPSRTAGGQRDVTARSTRRECADQ